MDPLNQNLAQSLTAILVPARPTAIVDVGANPIDGGPPHEAMLADMTSLLVPDPAHLALFNLFPIWGKVKERIPVATRKLDEVALIAHHCYGSYDLALKAIGHLIELGAVPADARKRCLAGLPVRKFH